MRIADLVIAEVEKCEGWRGIVGMGGYRDSVGIWTGDLIPNFYYYPQSGGGGGGGFLLGEYFHSPHCMKTLISTSCVGQKVV